MSVDEVLYILSGGLATLQIASAAWALAAVLGMIFALIGRSRFAVVRGVLDFVVTCLRGIPELVVMYLLFFGLSQIVRIDGMTAAIIALGLTAAAYASENFRAAFSTIGHRQVEAGASLGLARLRIFMVIEFPQMLRFSTPFLLNEFVGLLKVSTLASAIGVSEILYRGGLAINKTQDLAGVSLTLLAIYVVFTMPLIRVVGSIERRMRLSTG